jgi:hypothetical protein
MIIPLTQGKFAIVDDEDFEIVSQYKWCAERSSDGLRYYAVRNEGGKLVRMHRLIMGFPKGNVDHRDADGLNNSRSNLRLATTAQNGSNNRMARNNTSGFRGVSWNKTHGKWQVGIEHQGKRHAKCWIDTPEEAAHIYDAMARELHGEYARLNFPLPGERGVTPSGSGALSF